MAAFLERWAAKGRLCWLNRVKAASYDDNNFSTASLGSPNKPAPAFKARPIVPRYTPTERLGINAVEQIVLKELQWIFREQPIADMGIDAHIETANNGAPTGQLLALQIKTGASHFRDIGDALVYYGTNVHIDYWNGHSLPVLLVAHLPETNETYWVQASPPHVSPTNSAWKISIPKSNRLCEASAPQLLDILRHQASERDLYHLSKVNWTQYQPVQIQGYVPPTASHINLQYRLSSSDGNIPLLIRLASENGSGIVQEHSGPSGVADLMLTNYNAIYVSLSHPDVRLELAVLGWKDNL